MFLYPSHSSVVADQYLCSKSIDLLDMVLEVVDDKALESVRKIVKELSTMANDAVENHKSRQNPNIGDTFQEFSADWDIFLSENFGYSPFAGDSSWLLDPF